MNAIPVFIALPAFYIILHFWVYRIYPETSPAFPKCLFFLDKTAAAVGCIGMIALAAGYVRSGQTDIRLLILYYMGTLMLAVTAVTDLREKRIPNKVLLIMTGVWALYIAVNFIVNVSAALQLTVMAVSGMVFNGIVFLIGYFITKKKLGGGDVKLAAVLGLFFTMEKSFGVLLYGLIICSIFSAILLISRKAKAGTQIPLAPFLFAGALIMLQIN